MAVSVRALIMAALLCGVRTEAFTQQASHGPQGQSSLVISDSTSFWIEAPAGWVLDPDAGRRDGVLVAFYRKGESWQRGEPVMYASVATRKIGYNAVIPAMIRSDSANWAGQSQDFVFTVRDSVVATSGTVVKLRAYQSASTKHFDTIAYVQGEERVWIFGLSARSQAAHDAALADFLSLIRSFAPGPPQKPVQ